MYILSAIFIFALEYLQADENIKLPSSCNNELNEPFILACLKRIKADTRMYYTNNYFLSYTNLFL